MIQQRSIFDGIQYIQLHTTLSLRNITNFFFIKVITEKYYGNIEGIRSSCVTPVYDKITISVLKRLLVECHKRGRF